MKKSNFLKLNKLQAKRVRQSRFCSPAKVNLFFCVLGKYDEGFHEVYSVMTTLDFFDEISISISNSDELFCNTADLKMDSDNLVIKARDLFRKTTSIDSALRISLKKNIPLAAGLAGGSSNAATTLWALNEIFNRPLSIYQLRELASQLGSDVPFFFSSGLALVTKKGQEFKDLSLSLSKPIYLIINKDIQCFSADVFSKLSRFTTRRQAQHFFKDFCNGTFINHNDLLKPALYLYPKLNSVYENLVKSGVNPLLSGSGSTFFTLEKIEHTSEFNNCSFNSYNFIRRGNDSWY